MSVVDIIVNIIVCAPGSSIHGERHHLIMTVCIPPTLFTWSYAQFCRTIDTATYTCRMTPCACSSSVPKTKRRDSASCPDGTKVRAFDLQDSTEIRLLSSVIEIPPEYEPPRLENDESESLSRNTKTT